jgi:hypothetical protein
VNNTLDSAMNIAAGVIEPAAVILEGALKGATPAVIGFLGDQVGLGGVAEKIREIIDKLRAKVDGAILAIIDKLRAFFGAIAQGAGAAARKVLGWLGLRKEFSVDTQSHSLSFDQRASSPTLLLASTPVYITSWLNARREELRAGNQFDNAKEEAYNAISKDLRTLGGLTHSTDEKAADQEKTAKGLLDKIAVNVAIIGFSRATVLEFDPPKLAVGEPVLSLYKDPKWIDPDKERWVPGTVTSLDPAGKTFRWRSANLQVPRTGVFNIADFQKKWKKGHTSQIKIPEDEILELNMKQNWGPSMDIARAVLNYRHHQSQFNVPGTQWEHIIEQSGDGANSSGNLALTLSTINNRLGVLFGKPYASHEAPSGLPGTGDLPLRAYLEGKSLFIRNRWKQHFYKQLDLSLTWSRSDRGIWRELK